MFHTVLVANRGEIALRVIRTLRRMGIRAVAVYSDADVHARHVYEADLSIRIGPAPARESYLNVDRLLNAAAEADAEAVHPGYGFLAENAAFVSACAHRGVAFVGPSAYAVGVMGDKIRAKQAVSAAGVPVVPGRAEPGMSDADLVSAADEIGFPVLVKPSAGGGGKGMRLVRVRDELPTALVSARREASASFADDTLFIERFVVAPRHIEVQVLADTFGNTVHLGERECSLQRRHQKVVEEAPSVFLTPALRERYGKLAVATAESVSYTGAGTVEFIVSGERADEPYFMEMNTRLQVEHPVTELVTGFDLVEHQLRIAAGEKLSFVQQDVRLRGHAVECRIYAEDPSRGFLPTGGVALVVREPEDDGVRVDSALAEGLDVGTTYDPMLSKIIAWGEDRPSALARLDRALARTVVLGVGTNIGFLRSLLGHPDVRTGQLDTGLIERQLDRLTEADVPARAYVAFALHRLLEVSRPAGDPWHAASGWRPSGSAETNWRVSTSGGHPVTVTISGPPLAARVRIGDGPWLEASGEPMDGGLLLTVAGQTSEVTAFTHQGGNETWLHLDGATWTLREESLRARISDEPTHNGDIRSPMPGVLIAVNVGEGEAVREGQVLLIVEAMKMEHALSAPFDGIVERLVVHEGVGVVVDQLLASVAKAEHPDNDRTADSGS